MSGIEKDFHHLISEGLGFDMSDPNLKDTPQRVSRMYQELFKNVGKEFNGMTSFPNSEQYDQIIMMDNIHFTSVCSHHFLPFSGKAWFAYLPDQRLMGASKAARVITHYAAQPQLQENLCQQVVNYIEKDLQPQGIMLVMRAIHGCMACRGVYQYHGAGMITSSIRGVFKNPAARNEVMDLIKLSIMMEK
jgi:GTP cyclohydrolase I